MIRFSRLTGVVVAAAALATTASTASATRAQVCEFQNVTDTARVVNWVPPHVGGDRDFGGNGPLVSVRASLATRTDGSGNPNVVVHVDMTARETTSDFTTASGGNLDGIRIWTGFPGWRVEGVVGGLATLDSVSYTDTDHTDDVFAPSSPNSFVSGYRIVGDTTGDEAGTETFVQINIRPITLRLSRGCP